jgi:phosphomannomutase
VKISVSGIRGVYGSDLSLQNISRFARLFASSIMKPGQECVLGCDTRPSSRLIFQFVAANLMEQGINVYSLGVAPTPVVFRHSRDNKAGVVITASHNPLHWNGLKFIIDGRGLFEDEIGFLLDKTPIPTSAKLGRFSAITSNYVDEVANLISDECAGNKAKVGIDLGGGAACGYCNLLLKQLGHSFYSINDIRGISSRSPDPTAEELNELRSLVSSNNLDFGFAFDLDGDRLVVIDNKGQKLGADSTLLLCIARAITMGMKKFVSSVDTSISIKRYIEQKGCSLYYSKVGEANVVKTMLDTDSDAGGEGSSAGFIMPRFNMCRDGFLASAIIASLSKNIVDECMAISSQYLQVRSVLAVNSSVHAELIDKLTDVLKAESSEILNLDGVKAIVDDDSWILVRPSNTEDVLRISVESKTERSRSLFNNVREKVQSIYGQVK